MSTKADVVVPSVGESVSEAAIGKWHVKNGDMVEKDQSLFELESDKASMEVTAAASGKIEILVGEGEMVSIGKCVATIDTEAKAQASPAQKQEETSQEKAAQPSEADSQGQATARAYSAPEDNSSASETAQASTAENENSAESKTQAKTEDRKGLSDEKIKNFPPSQRKAIRHGHLKVAKASDETTTSTEAQDEVRKPMSPLRKTIAQRMVESQRTTASLTTFNEIDMTQVMILRSRFKDEFQKKHGIKLGFMSFFSAAVVYALRQYPALNSRIEGEEIVEPQNIHLGIAVSTERGLVVPVLRSTQRKSYAEIEKEIAELAQKARDGKLGISEMQGGTFTITNGGIFGSLLSTPIINPPQSGILGMHKTEHRPVAIQQENGRYAVGVRPMMYVALSYDHRIIDGATSVGFLVKVKEYLENISEEELFAESI